MQLTDLGKSIQAHLYESRGDLEEHPFFLAHPGVLSRLISKLTYCVRSAPVRYVAVDLSTADDQESFKIAVYTDDHLFHLVYDPSVDHITTTIYARTDIQLVEVLSAPNFMDEDDASAAAVKISVSYPNTEVRLPGDNAATDRNRNELDAFLPSLLRDLAHRGR